MITLCGTPISNYYNKVKLALLEKDVPFEERLVNTGSTEEAVLAASPLAKVPFLLVDGRPLCESQVIVDFIEARFPQPPLVPAEPFAAAKVRELAAFVDLHLELVVRELYGAVFFGAAQPSESNKARVHRLLARNIAALKRLARFEPFIAGDSFTLADCSAWPSLPLVSMATKAMYGEDLLTAAGIDIKAYLRTVGQRPSAAKVTADRKAAQAAAIAAAKG